MTIATAAMHTATELRFVGVNENNTVFIFEATSSRNSDEKYTVMWSPQHRLSTCDCPCGARYDERQVSCWHMDLVEQATYDEMATQLVRSVGTMDELRTIGEASRIRMQKIAPFWSLVSPVDETVYRFARKEYARRLKQNIEIAI